MTNRRLLRIDGVLDIVPVCRAEWYNRIRRGEAPAPIPIGPRAVAWLESDVQQYVDDLIANRKTAPRHLPPTKKGRFTKRGSA